MANQSKLPSRDTIVHSTLLNPLLTGPLLLYLQRNQSVLSRIPWPGDLTLTLPFSLPFNVRNSLTLHATPPLKSLKRLFILGLILTANRLLNRLALNYGNLRKQGVPWDFDGEGVETILITGGCSGFGREMVFLFALQTKANIIVVDVQDLPEEMKDSKSTRRLSCDCFPPPPKHT